MSNETDSSKSGKRHELLPSEVKRSEAAVQRAIEAIQGFLNPFNVADKERMYILPSGNPVPPDIANDVLSAEEVSWLERDKFASERLQKDVNVELKDFFDKLKKAWRRSTRR